MEITNQLLSYKEIEEGLVIEGDDYGVASYTYQPAIKDTFLSNPFLEDKTECMAYLSRVDGVVGGRVMFFPSRAKMAGEICISLGGSSLMVLEQYRSLAIGVDLILFPILNIQTDIIIYAGLSKMALPIYKKMKFHDLATPLMWQPRNAQFLFERLGMKGLPLFFLKNTCNLILKPFVLINNRIIKLNRDKRITIQKLDVVPQWVDCIISTDEHKYMEYHNHKWMQWVLDHNFFARENDRQTFYAVYQDGKEFGFFLTKERQSSIPERNIKKIVFGSIVEWGSLDEKVLSEYEIYKIAITTFSKNVDIVEFTSADSSVVRKMRKFGFVQHGDSHIVVKSTNREYPGIADVKNWRIRLGYSDVMFY